MKKDKQLEENESDAEYLAKMLRAETQIIEALKGFNQFQVDSMLTRIDFEVKNTSLVP
jgi:hypothetical protein|tara:strand:- start:3160 stop:3333 length:174 start_codon:yes stop_codon:yes gene_type:complete